MKNLDKTQLWNNQHYRSFILQAVFVCIVIAFFFFLVSNALSNMSARGISTGFSFLSERAGFGIVQSLIPYSEDSTYGRTFVVGLLNTVFVSLLGVVLATLLGFLIGIARLSKNLLIARLATSYIETFRNIPLLLQILFWYSLILTILPSSKNSYSLGEVLFINVRGLYFPTIVFEYSIWYSVIVCSLVLLVLLFLYRRIKIYKINRGGVIPIYFFPLFMLLFFLSVAFVFISNFVRWDVPVLDGFNYEGGGSIIPELLALLIALSIYTAAFIAEVVRSGIKSVNNGQIEAAYSLGLSKFKLLKLVLIPQAMRVIIPPLTNQYLNLTKNSSLAIAIGYPDLMNVFMGTTLNQTGQAIEITIMTMGVYLLLSIFTSVFMNWYNQKVRIIGR